MEKRVYPTEFAPRIDAFNQDCLDLFKELSLDTLLYKIALIASAQSNACYCISGLLDSSGKNFLRYYFAGLTPVELSRMGITTNPGDGEFVSKHPNETLSTTNVEDLIETHHMLPNAPFIRSVLYVPVSYGEERNGAILLLNKIGDLQFTETDAAMIEILAVYAGVAINNALVYEQTIIRERTLSKRNEDLALLNELAKLSASSTINGDTIIDEVMNQIMGYLDIEIGEVFLRTDDDENSFHLIFKKGHSLSTSIFGLPEVSLGEGIIGYTAEKKKIYILNSDEVEIINQKKPSPVMLNFITCLPLVTGEGTLGVVCLAAHQIDGAEPINLQFLNSITTWIATLLENVQLVQKQKVIAILEERERIGMDLHDGVIQSIYGVGLALEHARLLAEKEPQKSAARIQDAISALNATIRDIRSYIMNLKPDHLTHENLVQSLRVLANEYHANTLVNTDFLPQVEHIENLSDEQTNTFYLLCKEALSNITKHAGNPTRVNIAFYELPDRFVLKVADNGTGFDTEKKVDDTHHGVSNMHARTRAQGGDVEIKSAIGKGTTILAWLPNERKNKNSGGKSTGER